MVGPLLLSFVFCVSANTGKSLNVNRMQTGIPFSIKKKICRLFFEELGFLFKKKFFFKLASFFLFKEEAFFYFIFPVLIGLGPVRRSIE